MSEKTTFVKLTHFLDQDWAAAVAFLRGSDETRIIELHSMCVAPDPSRLINEMRSDWQVADVVQRAVILMIEECMHRIADERQP